MLGEITADERRALERLFESDGWAFIARDINEQLARIERAGLDSPSWDALQYNKGVRDTMRVLVNYDRILLVTSDETDSV